MHLVRVQSRLAIRGAGGAARAFTFTELVIGMAITAICMAALAALMAAVSAGWKQQGVTQSTCLNDRQAVIRVQDIVRTAKLIGLVKEGSLSSDTSDAACVLLWKKDTSGGTSDRMIQFSEIALLEHDRSSNELKYYTVKFPPSMTPAQIAAVETSYAYSALTASSAASDFKALNYVTPQTVAKNVTGAAFYANEPLGQVSQLPTFEFQLAFTRNGNTSQVYGSTALRNPDYKPAVP